MKTALRVPPTTTIPAAAAKHGLDDAACQRLARLLRGRAVLPEIFKRPRRYTVADVERAVQYDRRRHTPVPRRDDVYGCDCGRLWATEQARAAHVARGECREAS